MIKTYMAARMSHNVFGEDWDMLLAWGLSPFVDWFWTIRCLFRSLLCSFFGIDVCLSGTILTFLVDALSLWWIKKEHLLSGLRIDYLFFSNLPVLLWQAMTTTFMAI